MSACNVDKLLEAEVPVPVHLAMALGSTLVTTTPGGTGTVTASITRLGDFHGDVTFSFSNVPAGVTAEIGGATTVGAVTTVTITFRVPATATSGSALITIRGRGGADGVAAADVELRVVEFPAIALAPSRQSLTIIRGGIAPLAVGITRTNAPGPVALSLIGAAGISAEGVTTSGTTAAMTLAVAPGTAPGTYTVTLRGTSSGVSDRDVPITVVVSPDALQLIPTDAATAQAQVVAASVIINRDGISAPVILAVDGLPPGITAAVPGGAAGTTAGVSTIAFAVGASVPPGAYVLTLRASADGAATTAPLVLTVGASNVGLTLVPQNVNMLQGTAAASLLTLIRTAFTGAVSVQLLGVPAGITIEAADATITGASTTLVVTSSATIAPGYYPVTVRVVPAPFGGSGPALDPVTAALGITVLAAPTTQGEVLLDWSRCAAPDWVAAQDGDTKPWTRLAGTGGRFPFVVTSPRAGFAWTDGGVQLVARYATAAELAAAPIDLCPAAQPATSRSVTGTAQHSALQEQFTWRYGGGSAVSTFTAPNFTISGVRDGPHDLIGWGLIQLPGGAFQRMHLSRDLNPAPGESIGEVSLTGDRAFPPATVQVNVSGWANESRGYTISYLTTAACEANELYQLAVPTPISGATSTSILGVPPGWQRADDYHLIDVVAAGAGTWRAVSLSYHALTPRLLTLPPSVFPVVSTVAGSYRRLRLSFNQALPASYNGSLTLRYTDGSRALTVTTSTATLGTGTPVLDMPDLAGVSGFPASAVIPNAASGTWVMTVDGSNHQPLCSEESSRWSSTRTGAFSGGSGR